MKRTVLAFLLLLAMCFGLKNYPTHYITNPTQSLHVVHQHATNYKDSTYNPRGNGQLLIKYDSECVHSFETIGKDIAKKGYRVVYNSKLTNTSLVEPLEYKSFDTEIAELNALPHVAYEIGRAHV